MFGLVARNKLLPLILSLISKVEFFDLQTEELVLTAAVTSPTERVLDLFASLLQVSYHLVGSAFALKTPVAGDLASVPLDTAA